MADKIKQPRDVEIKELKVQVNFAWSQTFGKDKTERFETAQRFVDSECIRLMVPYTPMLNGILMKSPVLGTKIGSGLIVYQNPYARYQYYGEVYGPNIPITKHGVTVGFYSPPQKHPIGREIKYNTDKHALAGKQWFSRMKADKSEQILRGAAKYSGGTPIG